MTFALRTLLILLLAAVLLTISQGAPAEIVRDRKQVYAFRSTHPCPANGSLHGACPGHVVDHIKALECGGPDRPSNMQWQTIAAAKIKDRTEHLCRKH